MGLTACALVMQMSRYCPKLAQASSDTLMSLEVPLSPSLSESREELICLGSGDSEDLEPHLCDLGHSPPTGHVAEPAAASGSSGKGAAGARLRRPVLSMG